MLTLNAGSACDVCAEEYGPHCLPHSIPCGHVLCASCCNTIVEKTSPRLTPVCPFCREQFTSDTVRLIRIDFTSSGWSTPQRRVGTIEANNVLESEAWERQEERLMLMERVGSRSARAEARRLEDKVAKVAAKKCSVEEVSTLHKELQEWLTSEVKPDDQTSSLSLSAALLRAILMNHLAHSEASRVAKTVETNLREKLDDMEITVTKLEAELRKLRAQYTREAQEAQSLRTELSRLKIVATTLGVPPMPRSSTPAPRANTPAPRSATPAPEPHRQATPLLRSPSTSSHRSPPTPRPSQTPRPPSTSPTPSGHHSSSFSPLSRFNSAHSGHMRSTSMHSTSRPSTPSISMAMRSQTPAPPVPPLPTNHRRLSHPSPPKMAPSTSEEKDQEQVHQRWIPAADPDSDSPSSARLRGFGSTSASRTAAAATLGRYAVPSMNAT